MTHLRERDLADGAFDEVVLGCLCEVFFFIIIRSVSTGWG
jgi:hypothetical protein